MSTSTKPLVPIVYHFFAHYRAGINHELMRSSKYEFLFVGATDADKEGGIEAWNVPVDTNFLATKNLHPIGRPLFQSGLISLALRRDVKSIIFLGCAEFATTWVAAAVARLTGKRVLFWTHGWTKPDHGIKKAIRKIFYRLSHKMLLYGNHAKRIGIQEGFSPENLHVIYNSLDYSAQVAAREKVTEADLAKTRASLFTKSELPLLVYSGRLVPCHKIHLLLDAVQRLKNEGAPVNLLVVGDGSERVKLEAQARRDGLDIKFYGACYDESVLSRLLMAADLTVVPGRVGLITMHSLAYGTPVLVHDNPNEHSPEYQAVIPGFNGAYFSHHDEGDMTRAITDWLRHAPARPLLRKRCYEVIELFYNPIKQAKIIEDALDGKPADDSQWETFCRDQTSSKP